MRSRMKRTTPRTAGGATISGEARLHSHLDLLRDCADALLTSDAGVQEVFAKLAPALELDAFAAYAAAASGAGGMTLESAAGLSTTALSSTAVAGIVAELERAGRRTLVLESLRASAD